MNERRGDPLLTFTGRNFWPMDPRADEVCIKDIAHALSLQCRFAGHCREFYSVADHSVRVSYVVPPHLAMAGLLHDASEAYLVDVPRPVKRHLRDYDGIEGLVMQAIWERFPDEPSWGDWQNIHVADNVLLATEARDLMATPPAPWAPLPEPLPEHIVPMSPKDAEMWFLRRFRELGGQ